ncbi:MAG TPA: hypothetical protein VM925_37890 [Labilithrix sp.]|jgi:hypothetical protein|nr:hypothetical protein [Labilithrix sp.]
MTRTVLVALALALLAACGNKEPATPASPAASATSSSSVATSSEPPAAAEPAPEPRKRKPFEVYSACADVVTVVFAEDPKAPTSGKKTIAPSSAVEGPRNADGNQVVWLLDEKGEPLTKVNVTRGMKRVEIGKSCRTLDAR